MLEDTVLEVPVVVGSVSLIVEINVVVNFEEVAGVVVVELVVDTFGLPVNFSNYKLNGYMCALVLQKKFTAHLVQNSLEVLSIISTLTYLLSLNSGGTILCHSLEAILERGSKE